MLSGLLKRDVFAAIAAVMTMFAAGAAGAVDTLAKQAIIVDYQTGTVLFEKNADELIHPASMSKLMTLEILFQQLKKGQIKLNDTFPVSERAWAHNEGSTMFVGINTQVRVEDLIRGIVVQSGNDACIVVAEGLAGTEEAFVELMNKRAAELGLENSHFRNSHGLEDPNHKMTARDLLKLAEHIYREYPEYYHYFAEKEFVFNGIKQENRNPLIYKNIGVDGLKTGHLSVSGFGVVISAQRDGRRIFMVAARHGSMQQRSDEATNMVEWAFREFNNYTLAKAGAGPRRGAGLVRQRADGAADGGATIWSRPCRATAGTRRRLRLSSTGRSRRRSPRARKSARSSSRPPATARPRSPWWRRPRSIARDLSAAPSAIWSTSCLACRQGAGS